MCFLLTDKIKVYLVIIKNNETRSYPFYTVSGYIKYLFEILDDHPNSKIEFKI